jgi:hypothetical protein
MEKIIFIGYCWGAAGSAWLARLLNSHEDIFCVHAPILERYNHYVFEESVLLMTKLFTSMSYGGGYPIAGLTHGVPLAWHQRLNEYFSKSVRFRNFILIRHPIPRIQSSVEEIKKNFLKKGPDPKNEEEYKKIYRELSERSERKFPDDFVSLGFYHSCKMINLIHEETDQTMPIFKMENLVSQENEVQRLVSHISDKTVRLDPAVIRKLQQTVINKRSTGNHSPAEVYSSWNDHYRAAYRYLVNTTSIQIYSRLGYEFPAEINRGEDYEE